MTNLTATTALFLVRAREAGCSPFYAKFGDLQTVYLTRDEAQEMADDLNDDPCWGECGDKIAADVGLHYHVEEAAADEVNPDSHNLGDLNDAFVALAAL